MDRPYDDFEYEEDEDYFPRPNLGYRFRRKGEQVFQETFGTEIDFEEVKEEFSNIDALEEIASTEVRQPDFPFVTFFIALVLDLLDFFDFTGIGWFVMSIIEVIFSIALFFLMFGKLNSIFKFGSKKLFGRRGKKRLGKKRTGTKNSPAQKMLNKMTKRIVGRYMSRRLAAILIVNVIPLIGILASQAFFVYLAHNKQKKIAQKYIFLIEKIGAVLEDFYKRNER